MKVTKNIYAKFNFINWIKLYIKTFNIVMLTLDKFGWHFVSQVFTNYSYFCRQDRGVNYISSLDFPFKIFTFIL